MGGLSSGPGPGLCLITLVVLIVAQQVQSAPVQEDNLSPQSRAQGYYDGSSSELSTGCYYNFQHYGEGDRIITNEPCLNCTCHNRMLMCYLRVCPFTKAIGQNCTIEKKPGQCCPLIICPEVQLLTSSTTTEHSESFPHKNQIGYGQYGTAVGHLDDYGCKINGEFYTNGAQIPGNIDKPCEVCYCIRNRTACIMQECTLQVEGCIPVYEEGLCCPVRYQCDYEYNYNAITTEQPRPTPGLVLTTTTSGPFECQHDNKWYADGAMVETEDSCEHCYCMKGDIVCAVQECKPPFEKDGHNCTAMPPAPGKCCPDSYHCDGNEIVDESEPTFRQDRMHKFGQNNANITMSITSSTSSGDKQHSWHYGTSSNENEMPNRFTDEHDKDGTTKPGKPTSESDMMITEGVPPTSGPLESESHHIDGHGGESGMRPQDTHTGMRPTGQSSTGQGHGVNTDNMLTISQVIHSIVQNQTNLFNQNRVNQTGKPDKPSQHDDKIVFPTDLNLQKTPGMNFQTDEDGNPIEAQSGTTEFPNEYYGLTGSVPNIYAQQGGRPQKKPTTHTKPGTQGSIGQPASGENQDFGGHKRPGMTDTTGDHGITQHPQKKPIIHHQPGMTDTLVETDDEGNPIEIYGGVTGRPEMASGQPGSSGVYSTHGEKERPKQPGMEDGFTGRPDSDGIYSSLGEYGQSHKRPTTHKKPSDVGGEDVMGSHDFSGKPGIHQPEIFGEHGHTGRPHGKPITHKKPGAGDEEMVTETYEDITGSSIFTGKPVTDEHGRPLSQPGFGVMTDGDGVFHGRPQKIPSIHKKPGSEMSEDDITEGYQTVTETIHDLIDSHENDNSFTGRPSIHKKPGSSESPEFTEGHGKPITDSHGHDGEYIYYDKYGKPHKRPVVHKRPGSGGYEEETYIPGTTQLPDSITHENAGQDKLHTPSKKPQIHITPGMTAESDFTDEDGNPFEEIAGFPDADEFETFYDKYGRPHKRPTTVHKTPTGVMTDEYGKPIDEVEGATDLPEGMSGKPDQDGYQIFYDQYGRPHRRPVTHKKPGDIVLTDEHGKPVDGAESVTDFPEGITRKPDQDGYQIFYDQYGRPHKRPVTHKKPVSGIMTDEHAKPVDGVEGVTGFPEGFTGKPDQDVYQIFYDEHGRPHRRPVTHKKPGDSVLTDEHGKPVDELESVTDLPEGFAGKPGLDGYQIFYDQHGRPHRRPVTHKKPGDIVLTDEQGKPVDGAESVTDFPEGITGKPDQDGYQIFYDQYGRPHKRPVTHKKPVSGVLTDEDGNPVDGVQSVTDFPEGFTGKPSTDDQEIFYDEHGRPQKRPVTHKKPGDGVMTDEHAKPVDEMEGVTGKPEQNGYQIFYDQHGRPYKRPVIYKKPGDGVLTDEHGKPLDGAEFITEIPEGFTGKPGTQEEHIFYDQHGRPHKRPVTHKKPVSGVMTDEDGKPEDETEGVTDYPEGITGKPDQEGYQIFYDQHGRPHRRPVTHKKPTDGVMTDEHAKPVDEMEGVTDLLEGFTGKPDTDEYQIFYDEHGRPHKRPVTHKKPVSGVLTDEHVKPVDHIESVTDFPESFTGKPVTEDGYQIFYDQYGRPHKRPVTHKKPVYGVLTDEHGEPVEGVEGVTDLPEGMTGQPDQDGYQIFYDKHGRPHKRPVIYKKPGDGVLTDEHGKPLDGAEFVTDLPESFTEKPGTEDEQIFYDEHGRPHRRPVTHKKPVSGVLTDEHGEPVDGVEGVTELPEGMTGKPDQDGYQIFYDEHGRPHKRPVTHKKPVSGVLTDEHGKPVDGPESVTDFPEGFTGKPGTEDEQIFYDEHGRPHKRPVTHKKPVSGILTDKDGKPMEGAESVTDLPEGMTGKPDQDGYQIFYDEHGRPHKRPVTHKKPVSGVMTDEYGKPIDGVEGVTDLPEGITGKPDQDGYQIFYDEHGRPHKRPVTHKKPVPGVLTDEYGKPVDGVEGVTDFPGGFTGKPGTEDEQIFYDEHGRPHKRPIGHKKPGGVLTDEQGKPVDGAESVTDFPEGITGKPDQDGYQIFYDEHGRPHKRPVTHKKPVSGVLTDEQDKPVYGVESVTDLPEGFTGKPGTEDEQIFYDEHGRPHKRPVTHKKPGSGVMTDEHSEPVDGVEGVTDFPEGFTGKPGTEDEHIIYDEHGRPHRKPVTHKKPGTDGEMLPETHETPIESVTKSPGHVEGLEHDDTTENITVSGNIGRPDQKPGQFLPVPEGDEVVTVGAGASPDVYESTTITSEKEPGSPIAANATTNLGKPDVLERPHLRPDSSDKPSGAAEGISTDEVDVESYPGVPGNNIRPAHDINKVVTEKPLPHTKPEENIMTSEKEQTLEVPTHVPVEQTDKHHSTGSQQDLFDEVGSPHEKPGVHKKPGENATTEEKVKPGEEINIITEIPEGLTSKPESDSQLLFYDQFGRPHRRPVTHKKPVSGILTDENGEPVEGVEGVTDLPEGMTGKPDQDGYQIFYDEHGRPHKRPVIYKKPGDGVLTDEHGKPLDGAEFVTDLPEGFTGKPETEDEQIFYDEHGRPHKRPVTHKKPVSGILTDEHGEPVDGVESVTDIPEGLTGKPGTEDEQIFYDEHGRPHKRPVTHKKPVSGVLTDEHGKPVGGLESVTDLPEGFTGKPGTEDEQIFYDEHGRPHKRPVTHKKPVSGVLTDEDDKPIDGVEDITSFPEGFTGKPGTEDEHVYFDEHGRPHKRPVTHKKPGDGVMTNVDGEPTDKHTDKPDDGTHEVLLDPYGLPGKKPVTPTKPEGTETDEEYEGTTEPLDVATTIPESVSEGVMYDNLGRPQKKPDMSNVYEHGLPHGKPQGQTHDSTDHIDRPHSRPSVIKEPSTDFGESLPEEGESFTKEPTEEDNSEPGVEQSFFGETGRPQKKPVLSVGHKHPGSAETAKDPVQIDSVSTETGEQIIYDEHGRPHKKPVTDTRPSLTDESESSTIGETGAPDSQTGKPGSDEMEIFYDKYGKPHKRPISHVKPDLEGTQVLTDETDQRPKEKDTTETPEEQAAVLDNDTTDLTDEKDKKPALEKEKPGYDTTVTGQDDLSQEKPDSYLKPTVGDMTEKEPDREDQIFGEHGHTGRPQKIPNVPEKLMPEENDSHVGLTTELPETGEMDIIYDKYGRPHKRPTTDKKPQVITPLTQEKPGETMTGEHDVPHEEMEVINESLQTDRPEHDSEEVSYDEHGRPYKPPVVQKKPGDVTMIGEIGKPLEEGDPLTKVPVDNEVTEAPDGFTGKPGTEDEQIFYDEHGGPHRRPVTHTKPVSGVLTDGDDKPIDGVELTTAFPEGFTGKPGTEDEHVYFDEHGRPHKRPVGHRKPGDGVLTDEHGKPVDGPESVTDFPEGFTGKPGTEDEQIFYDEHGRPHKRPVTHKKPVSGILTDEHGEPVDGVEGVTDIPEGLTGKPGTENEQIFYDEHGRPHKRPVTHKKPVSGVLTDEHGKPVDGAESVTDLPEGFTAKPGTEDEQIFYDEHGRPHKRPVTHKKPVSGVLTDEYGKPVDGAEGVTDFPEGFTGKPGTEDEQIFYDEHGRPHTRPIGHKKPGDGVLTDEQGKPVDGAESITDFPEGMTGKPDQDGYQIFYDEHGRPHKRPVTHKKPVSGVLTDEQGKPVYGVESVTDLPEGFTGKPGTEDEQIFYDEHGRPHKRPVTHKKPGSGVMTDEHSEPVDGVEGVTDFPEGFTGKPGTEDEHIIYDEHGRPHRKPVTHKKPGTDGQMLPETHETPIESVTKSPGHVEGPEHDGTTEIMFGYGYTGTPDQKPVQLIPGPEGISTTEKVGSMTLSPESSTSHSAETGKPDDVGGTSEHGEPHEGDMEALEGQKKKPEQDETSEVHGEPVYQTEEKPQSQTKPSEHEEPEQEEKHPVDDYQKPSDHLQPGVTEENEAAGVEDLTETPHSGNEDQLMIFGEHGHTGRPHKRPPKPSVPVTSESENISGTPEEKPETPVTSQAQDVPVDGTPIQKIPDLAEDHEATNKKKPESESDEMATIAPEKVTTDDKDQVLHQKPGTEESQLTGDEMETSDKGTTLAPDEDEQKKPIAHPDEEAVPAEERPESHSPGESVTEKLGDDATEIYYDNLGEPQKRPVHSRPSGSDHMPETGVTDLPTISSEHGIEGDQHKPLTTSPIDGPHSTEGTFHEKPDEMTKPGSADGDEKKPEFDEGEPTYVSHPEKPHEKPVLTPGLDTTGVTVDKTGEPETGAGLSEIPEAGEPPVYHEETGPKPSKKPTTQEVDEDQTLTTKLPSGAVHDSKIPGVYDGQTAVDHKPEENEIFGVPEKEVSGVDDDSVTKVPEVPIDTFDKLPTSQKKPTATGHESEDGHTGSSGTVITPEGDQASIDDDTATEEDDESLVITTDESEEDKTEVHAKPESDAEGKPLVTTPNIPSHIVPGQQGSTPGLGSESDNLTTPTYGAHDASGVSVTEKDGTAHVTSGKPDEHVPGMSPGLDEESKPEDVTTPKGISDSLSSTTEQVVSEEDHAKPAGADKTSEPTGSTPVPEEDGDESHVPEKDLNKVSPGGISETTVGHGDTHLGLSPTQETDEVTSSQASVLPEVITPASTPEGTHGVPESTSSVPSGEVHPAVSSTVETPGKVSEAKPAPYQPPQIFIPYLPPDDGSSTSHPILIDEALHESSAPFDDIINNLANILRPSQTTEEPVGTTEDHGDIPGEGSCFMDGVTYQHNEDIPPLSPCHTKCTCVSSIIHCLSLKCPPPPEDASHCTLVHEENSCCPIYVCGTDVSPTLPVENHEGETTTDSSADKDESATVHGYEPSKPTKPGVPSQTPVTESEDSSHINQETPIKHETDDKTSQESKPGVVGESGESKKPEFGGEVPEESDKGTPLTERPEDDSVDETHTSQDMDQVMPSKPESTVTETSTGSKTPTKTTEVSETPDTAHIRPGEPQSGYHPIPSDDKHPSTILPVYFGTETPYQWQHKPESVDHVLDTGKPDQEGIEPTSAAESVKPQEEEQKPVEMDGSKPYDFNESATHRPVHHGTTKPVGGLSQEDETPEKDTAGEVEPLKPTEDEKEIEPSKPHDHDETETETDVHSTLEEQVPVKKPVEKPDDITFSKGKPQSGQEPAATGEESEHQTTERPGEKEPSLHTGTTSKDEEMVDNASKPHEKPEMGGKPSYLDVTPDHTTVEPHGESPVTEESYNKHQSTDEPEHDFVQSSSQKPGLHESPTPDLSAESDPSVKRPVTHDKPSEGEQHKPTSTLDSDRPMETSESKKPGQPTSDVNGTETIPTEVDVISADKTHPSLPGLTSDTVNEDEEPSKKPEESTDEPNQTLAYSTTQPVDHSESGKPLVPSGDITDMHKKPQPGHHIGEETFVTSGGPPKEFSTEIYPSPVSEDSENITPGPHEETPEEKPEEHEGLDEKHPSVHPPSMDNESAFTTEEPSAEDKKPEGKPETEVHPILTDEKSTAKPDEEPSVVEHSQTSPESGEGLVVRPTEEGAVFKKPTVSEKPAFGEKVPLGEQDTGLVHLTTESQITDEKPEGAKPQHAQDFSSTVRPKPTGVHGVSGQGGVQTDDIPEEVLLHPTRTPGTYETERPDLTPDEEEEDTLPSQKPHTEDENLATIFPQGIIRPITKRPIYGTGKPVVSDNKESTTPGYPFIHLGPQTNQVSGKPEETFEVTARPIFDIMTDIPEDFAQLFGIKPSTVHGQQPDKDGKPEHTTHTSVPGFTTGVSDFKPQTVDHVKRPIHTTNGTHFIQYVPYKEGEVPLVPDGATLGELIERPDGQKYWPIIYMKLVTTTPGAEISQMPFKPIPQQVFNETHFIQYVPYDKDGKPEVPEGAALGQPQKGPDNQLYWPIIGKKPIMVPVDKPVTEPPYPGQVFNGTHFIQYVPFREGQKPEVPEEATLGEPENAPNGQKYWPIISTKPIPEDDTVTPQSPVQSQPEQIFNGTHFIQFAPYNDGQEPEIPEEATLGQPQKGPDGQVYWPIIDTKPLPIIPEKLEPATEQPFPSVQVFNGTNFIQYVPFKDGVTPEVPEGATLGQPQKGPDGQMYWPIIYMRPRPVKPQGSFPEQVYNGTNYIQYVPYEEGRIPEVPSHATLGQPQKAPDGQMYWPIIYMKPVTAKPEDEKTTERPSQAPVFNGTHFIQYVPYMEGFEPDIPDEATLGKPEKRPDGETYWPIIYHKLPTRPKPETVQHYPGQFFNGTHFVQYLPYRPSHKPQVPEGVTLSQPQKGPDGQMYWMLVSTKPFPAIQEKPTGPQFFNGTHFIQYVPYEKEKEPEVPEGATLGRPEVGTGGQKFWPIIYMKPIPGIPITYQKPLDQDEVIPFDPFKGQAFNGTHYVQYILYEPGKTPNVPQGATLGQPTKRPNGQLYWPIYYLRPIQGTPIQGPMFWPPYDSVRPQSEQVFNGTHFIQYLPYNPTRMPEVPEGATLGQPQKGPEGQMYWVIISDKPLPAQAFNDSHVVQYVTPVTPEQAKPPTEQNKPIQVFNGTHYIQYVPYTPGQKPVLPEGASLGQPTQGPEGQIYWPIIYMKPQPGKPTQHVPILWGPSHDHVEPVSGQIFNGTHYIRFVKYDPSMRPIAPEGATIGEPQRRPDGHLYWVIASKKPLFDMQIPVQQHPGQIFNGTHYIQYVPYNASQMPQVPEGAILGHPQKGPEGQMYWVIISDKPLPAQPGTQYVQYVTPVTPEDEQMVPGPMFNGTHFIQYVPYKMGHIPKVPQDAILGELHKGPGGQMYWPIIYRKPPQSFNGTHYIQHVPDGATGTDSGKPSTGTHHIQPVNATSKPAEDHPFWSYGQYAPRPGNGTLPTVNKYPSQKPGTEEHAFWTYDHDKPKNGSGDSYPYKPTTEYPSWSPGQIHNVTKVPEISKLPSGQYGGGDHSRPGYEHESGYYKPEKPERPSTPEDSYEGIDEDHLIEYPSGSDYDETQEQPYGPGTCRYAGKVYVSAQQIPRDDPCDFCFCFRSDIICLQQSCPPPIPGCHEEPIQGFCCPRYECHVRMATLLNVTSTTTTTTTTLPPHFLSHVYKGAAGRTGCFIQGKAYRVGQAIPSASGPCMDCMCGGDGKMKCEPKVCTPEPMVRQMMVSSEKPITANHR